MKSAANRSITPKRSAASCARGAAAGVALVFLGFAFVSSGCGSRTCEFTSLYRFQHPTAGTTRVVVHSASPAEILSLREGDRVILSATARSRAGGCGLDGMERARAMHFVAETAGDILTLRAVGETGRSGKGGSAFEELFVRIPPGIDGEWTPMEIKASGGGR